jgi:hypothetical protein
VELLTVSANEVRVPAPAPGQAILVTKHGTRTKAVVMHPDDFELVRSWLDLLSRVVPSELKLSELELEVHRRGERGEDELEFDYEALERALEE